MVAAFSRKTPSWITILGAPSSAKSTYFPKHASETSSGAPRKDARARRAASASAGAGGAAAAAAAAAAGAAARGGWSSMKVKVKNGVAPGEVTDAKVKVTPTEVATGTTHVEVRVVSMRTVTLSRVEAVREDDL